MTILLTILRGLRSRATLSVGSLIVMVLSIGAAVLGPMFQDAAVRSYTLSRVDEASDVQTALTWVLTRRGTDRPLPDLVTAARAVLDSELPAQYQDPDVILLSTPPATASRSAATYLARQGVCGLLVVAGRCPVSIDEVLINEVDLAAHEVGDRFEAPALGRVEIVGTYATPTSQQDWLLPSRLASIPASNLAEARPAPYIVTPEAFALLPAPQQRVLLDSRLGSLPELSDGVLDELVVRTEELSAARFRIEGGGVIEGTSGLNQLDEVVLEVREQRTAARAAVAPAVIALVLVALAMLLRLLSSAAELRVSELALASLRGTGRRRTWILGLAEPMVLIVLSAPLGVLAGYGATIFLVREWLRPGLSVDLPTGSLIAGATVALGAVAAAVLAVSGSLRESLGARLAGQGRPKTGSRVAVVVELVLVALALTLPLARAGGEESSGLDATGLLLPVVLALAAGLVVTRVIALAAGAYAARRSGGSLVGFLAVRALSRRAQSTLVMLPLTAAIAVAIFAVGVSDTASNWRASLTATRTPADAVYTSQLSLDDTVALTRSLDPDGRFVSTAAIAGLRSGPLVLLDSARMPHVGTWSGQWLNGDSAAKTAHQIAPPGVPPRIVGERLTITLTNDTAEATTSTAEPLFMRIVLDVPSLGEVRVSLGPFRSGTETRTVAVAPCASGCEIRGFSIGAGAVASATSLHGTLSITSLGVDGSPQAAFTAPGTWEPQLPGVVISTEPEGPLTLKVDTGDDTGLARVGTTAYSGALRALVGTEAIETVTAAGQSAPAVSELNDSVPVEIVGRPISTPFLGPRGTVMDLDTARARLTLASGLTTPYILVQHDAPTELIAALVATGAELQARADETRRSLDASAYAQALRLYEAVGALTLTIALGGLLVSLAVQMPARRRDAAALRVVGVPRRTIALATWCESFVTLSAAALAGLAAGVLAQALLLQSLTLGVVQDGATPPVLATIDLSRLAIDTLAIATTLILVAVGASISVIRRAQGATLRESAR